MILATQIAIPSNGNSQLVFSTQPNNESQLSIRNTGTVSLLLGGSDGNLVFPLAAGEYLGVVVTPEDGLYAKVASAGTAGQITLLST